MPKITKISQMWTYLDVYTFDTAGNERRVNHLNEWGGFSRVLGMPVFTGWERHTRFDRVSKMTSADVSDSAWGPSIGLNNQERWVDYALKNGGRAAFFVIHAVDYSAAKWEIDTIDSERVVIGEIRRVGTIATVTGQPQSIDNIRRS